MTSSLIGSRRRPPWVRWSYLVVAVIFAVAAAVTGDQIAIIWAVVWAIVAALAWLWPTTTVSATGILRRPSVGPHARVGWPEVVGVVRPTPADRRVRVLLTDRTVLRLPLDVYESEEVAALGDRPMVDLVE